MNKLSHQKPNSRNNWSFQNWASDDNIDPDPSFQIPKNNWEKFKLLTKYIPLLLKYKKGVRKILWRS
jgi:hypothetical protein